MNSVEFRALLIRIHPAVANVPDRHLPELAKMAALHAFASRLEGADVEILRSQLVHLNTVGIFDLDDER